MAIESSDFLTDQAIKKAKAEEKQRKLFDGRGLFLLVSPAGGKLWRMKYQFSGKERLLALGKYPEVTLAMARERREEARRLLATGVDPSELKKASKADRKIGGIKATPKIQNTANTAFPPWLLQQADKEPLMTEFEAILLDKLQEKLHSYFRLAFIETLQAMQS